MLERGQETFFFPIILTFSTDISRATENFRDKRKLVKLVGSAQFIALVNPPRASFTEDSRDKKAWPSTIDLFNRGLVNEFALSFAINLLFNGQEIRFSPLVPTSQRRGNFSSRFHFFVFQRYRSRKKIHGNYVTFPSRFSFEEEIENLSSSKFLPLRDASKRRRKFDFVEPSASLRGEILETRHATSQRLLMLSAARSRFSTWLIAVGSRPVWQRIRAQISEFSRNAERKKTVSRGRVAILGLLDVYLVYDMDSPSNETRLQFLFFFFSSVPPFLLCILIPWSIHFALQRIFCYIIIRE